MSKRATDSRIKRWFSTWKKDISDYSYLITLSILGLVLATIICYYASSYVDKIAANPINDLILDNIPSMNMQFIYVYGFMLLNISVVLYSFLFHVKSFHKIAFMFCLLIIIRSSFITLTHLGLPTDAITITGEPMIFRAMNFQNDLFFSGHAAMSFMAFLVFRKEIIGMFYLLLSLLLSATVLLMHVHYSIDVFSAFFITYGVYKFGEWVSKKGYMDFGHPHTEQPF